MKLKRARDYESGAGGNGLLVCPLRLGNLALIRPAFKLGDWSTVEPIRHTEFDVIGPDLRQSILVVGSTGLPSPIFPRV